MFTHHLSTCVLFLADIKQARELLWRSFLRLLQMIFHFRSAWMKGRGKWDDLAVSRDWYLSSVCVCKMMVLSSVVLMEPPLQHWRCCRLCSPHICSPLAHSFLVSHESLGFLMERSSSVSSSKCRILGSFSSINHSSFKQQISTKITFPPQKCNYKKTGDCKEGTKDFCPLSLPWWMTVTAWLKTYLWLNSVLLLFLTEEDESVGSSQMISSSTATSHIQGRNHGDCLSKSSMRRGWGGSSTMTNINTCVISLMTVYISIFAQCNAKKLLL